MECEIMIDNDKFISEIQRRPAIWNLNSELYSCRNEKVKAWEEICEILIKNFKNKSSIEKRDLSDRLLRKWKSLRDCFNRELAKQKKIGSAACGRKKYIYFKQLSFLKNLHDEKVPPTAAVEESGEHELEEQNKESLPTASSSSNRKATKRNIDAVDIEILKKLSGNFRNKYARCKNENADDDPDKHFLMSVLPDIRKIHDDVKIDFKSEMLQLIKKYKLYESIQDCNTFPSPSYGYSGHSFSSQEPVVFTRHQATTSTSMSSPSALSNYSNNSPVHESKVEVLFDNET